MTNPADLKLLSISSFPSISLPSRSAPSPTLPGGPALLRNPIMDSVESFLSQLLIKILHKSAPALSPEDDAKVTKAVQDFITTTMDLTAIYFALKKSQSIKS